MTLWPTFPLQKVLAYLQPLLRNPPRKLPNYTAVRAVTPFKVIQGHRVWYQSYYNRANVNMSSRSLKISWLCLHQRFVQTNELFANALQRNHRLLKSHSDHQSCIRLHATSVRTDRKRSFRVAAQTVHNSVPGNLWVCGSVAIVLKWQLTTILLILLLTLPEFMVCLYCVILMFVLYDMLVALVALCHL